MSTTTMHSQQASHAPATGPRFACLVKPPNILIDTRAQEHVHADPVMDWGEPAQWAHPDVSLTSLVKHAFRASVADLLQCAQRARSASAGGKAPPDIMSLLSDKAVKGYTLFSSQRGAPGKQACLVSEGNLMKKAQALDPRYAIDYMMQPRGVCLSLHNVTGKLSVARPEYCKMFVAERSSEKDSWTKHTARRLDDAICITTTQKNFATGSEMKLNCYSKEGIVRYSTMRSAPSAADAGAVLRLDHHASQRGEADVEVYGNVAYEVEFHKATALVYLHIHPNATSAFLSDLTTGDADVYVEYSGAAAYVTVNPGEALRHSSGVEAINSYLEVRRPPVTVAAELPPAERAAAERRARAEALAQHVTFDLKGAVIYFRGQPLLLRTHDNVHYAAFLMCDDARARIPLCYFVRRSAEEMERMRVNPLMPLCMRAFDDAGLDVDLLRTWLDAESTFAAMKSLTFCFGTPVVSYRVRVDESVCDINYEAIFARLGAEIHVGAPPLSAAPLPPSPAPTTPCPATPYLPTPTAECEPEPVEVAATSPLQPVTPATPVTPGPPPEEEEAEAEAPTLADDMAGVADRPVLPPRQWPHDAVRVPMLKTAIPRGKMLMLLNGTVNVPYTNMPHITDDPVAIPLRRSTVQISAAVARPGVPLFVAPMAEAPMVEVHYKPKRRPTPGDGKALRASATQTPTPTRKRRRSESQGAGKQAPPKRARAASVPPVAEPVAVVAPLPVVETDESIFGGANEEDVIAYLAGNAGPPLPEFIGALDQEHVPALSKPSPQPQPNLHLGMEVGTSFYFTGSVDDRVFPNSPGFLNGYDELDLGLGF